MHRPRPLTLVLAVGVVLLPAAARAQVTTLRQVPSSVTPQVRQILAKEHDRLTKAQTTLLGAASALTASCQNLPDPSPQLTKCLQDQASLKTERTTYNAGADAYNGSVVTALDDRISELRAAIARDQTAIRNLGVYRNAAEFNDLGKWATAVDRQRLEQADAAFRDTQSAFAGFLIGTAITRGFDSPLVTKNMAKFGRDDAAAVIVRLQKAKVDDPVLFTAIRQFGRANGKDKAAAAAALCRRLRQAKSIWDLRDLGPDTESAKWKIGASLLGVLIPDPKLQLMAKLNLAMVRASFYAVSANLELRVVDGQIDRLTALTEQQLLNLKDLSARLDADVDLLTAAKAERVSLT